MSIETIYTLPTLVRNEEEGNFEYPEKYVGKLFIFNEEYVYFHKRSYQTFPKKLLEMVIDAFFKENPIEIPKQNLEDDRLNEIQESFNNQLATLSDKLQDVREETINLEDLEQFKTQLQNQINSYIQENIQNVQSNNNDNTVPEDRIREIVNEELKIVHQNLKNVVKEIIIENQHMFRTSKEKSKPSLMHLGVLKEAGYSVEEIVELKNNDLL